MKTNFLNNNLHRNFSQVDEAAFVASPYDAAASMYDANFDNLTGTPAGAAKQAQPRKKIRSNFDLTFTNGAAVALNVELFNELNSFLNKQRLDFVNGAYTYLPVSASPNNLIAVGSGTVGHESDGGLYVRGAANDGTQLRVKCAQFPYKGLLMASAKGYGFKIVSIRMTVTTDSQIDNEIVHTKSSFLGSKSQNRISPRNFFRPEQFQGKIIDIPIEMLINAEHGIEYLVNAAETVKWNVIIER